MAFKIGDIITTKEPRMGLENVKILGIKNFRNKKCYKAQIINGVAYIPVTAESRYKLCTEY